MGRRAGGSAGHGGDVMRHLGAVFPQLCGEVQEADEGTEPVSGKKAGTGELHRL